MSLLFIHWNPDPFLHFGSAEIRWYSLLFGLAVLSGCYLLRWFFIRENAPQSELLPLYAVIFFGGIIGARLVHCFFYDWAYFSQHPDEILMFWNGGFRGLASHGGGLGMITGIYLFSRFRGQIHFWWYIDRLAIALPAGGILIRLGNLINSEIIGLPADVPWAFIFESIDQVPRHPVQIYEMIMLSGLLAFMLYQYLNKLESIPFGRFVAWFFIVVPTGRFFIDYFKNDEYWMLGLKTGQILHIPFLILGIFLWYMSEKRRLN